MYQKLYMRLRLIGNGRCEKTMIDCENSRSLAEKTTIDCENSRSLAEKTTTGICEGGAYPQSPV
jgi:hypothetical protein